MKHVARWCAIVLLVSVSLVGGSSVASAAPPGNDEVSGAVVISQLPFTDSRDVSGATESPSDPFGCFGVHSVWYRYTPTETVELALDTFGSTFDTHLSVWTGGPGAWEMVDFCADSNYDDVGATMTTFTAVAGTEYLIEVATCCDYPGGSPAVDPGHLTLHAYVAPSSLEATLTVDPRPRVDRHGVVTLTGTVTCSIESLATHYIVVVDSLSQRRAAISTGGSRPVAVGTCGPTPTAWSIEMSSITASRFRPGPAQLTIRSQASWLHLLDDDGGTVDLRLRRR